MTFSQFLGRLHELMPLSGRMFLGRNKIAAKQTNP